MTPEIVCLTPVKNEAWILESFLRAASHWADRIVVLDQESTDASPAIAERFEKVHLVRESGARFDESSRQQRLIAEARALATRQQILIAVDADEALSANIFGGPMWEQLVAAAPGTLVRFRLANFLPGGRRAWIPPGLFPFGYVDDGADHHGTLIHTPRVPVRDGAPELVLDDGVMIHRQYLDWNRMKAKQRWYQCWELLNDPRRSALDIYRQYHHMDAVPEEQFVAVPDEWLAAYRDAGIDLRSVGDEEGSHWDEAVATILREHGVERFRRLEAWGGFDADPRRRTDRLVARRAARDQGRSESDRERALGELALRRAG